MSKQRQPGETSFPDIDEVDEQWKEPGDEDSFVREATCEDEPVPEKVSEPAKEQTGASQ
ncbi:MAG: hypothetical protein M0R77_06400 [Gammaproteobacteria bacterium]|nr:hypothetical protein [Gammaproteobacteria bacterium]